MKKEEDTHEAVAEQEERPLGESSRRDFLRQGGIGLAGVAGAAALGEQIDGGVYDHTLLLLRSRPLLGAAVDPLFHA